MSKEREYVATADVLIDGREVKAGATVRLHPARAQFLEAEGLIEPAKPKGSKTTKAKGA